MSVKIINTEGYGLLAEVEVNGRRLHVMDDFSSLPGELCQRRGIFPGKLMHNCQPEFDFLESEEPWTWEDMFLGNPKREKRLVRTGDWAYDAYGTVISIKPVVVDFGAIQLEIGDFTQDPRCVGEWVLVKIARLDMTIVC